MGRLTKEEINKIVGDRKIITAIETGTCRGVQLEIIAQCFEFVYGIELDERYAEVAQKRVPKATIINGDTRKYLPIILKDVEIPICFFLDAHYCELKPPIAKSEFPLWDELDFISKRKVGDIVIIDDVHTFGKDRPELRFKEGAKEWESVTPEEIMKYFPGCKSEIIKDSFVIWTSQKG